MQKTAYEMRISDWSSDVCSSDLLLHPYAIRPIQQFAYSTGKNASEMGMVIDAMDLLYARNLDGFAIVSSDADFTPLVMRLRNDGVAVYGFGEEKTPEPFVKACSVFLYLEKLGAPEGEARDAAATTKARTQHELQGDAALARILRNAVDAAQGDDGWSHLGAVGSHIRSEEHTSELQSLMRNSYAVFCLKK